ncbi:MAG: rod shape-determining protein MreC [Anaerolineae bacterium]
MRAGHRSAVALVVVLFVVLVWMVLDGVGAANPIRDSLTGVISPLQLVFSRAVRPLTSQFAGLRRGADLVRENEDLTKQTAELRSQLILLSEAQHENEELRRQLDFKSAVPNYQLIAAEVIGRDPSSYLQYLIIDRGLDDGIRQGMPVLTDAGLVGRIARVSQGSSQVMLLTDSQSSVGAYIQRSRATGVVQGQLGSDLVMNYILQDETVVVGDVILTSGLGGAFPKRLVIGQVVETRQTDVDMHQNAIVAPAVDLGELEMVMVLLNHDPGDLVGEP